ncbi:hypothetical protein EVAR_57887_1 [Eumeta japonica]|uniref:Uncharacterized protein n=1 Tax=Eumeta variegata TaxID=151549 RepID=A0A4C1YRQ9_EUMVA|nr:hypothetical protein EVAR_57887_1 [Eumeta japonica]
MKVLWRLVIATCVYIQIGREVWRSVYGPTLVTVAHTVQAHSVYRSLEPSIFSLSADRRFLLLARDKKPLHTHSYLARYTVYDVLTTFKSLINPPESRPAHESAEAFSFMCKTSQLQLRVLISLQTNFNLDVINIGTDFKPCIEFTGRPN